MSGKFRHRKMKRIAFADYLPVIGEWLAAKKLVLDWVGRFYGDVEADDGPVIFDLGGFLFDPPVCYEVMLPDFVADAVPDIAGKQNIACVRAAQRSKSHAAGPRGQ